MIRIDEIYNHTFWPWFQQHRPGVRMFFCDPFGHTRPENLFNFGTEHRAEHDYVFFHDQEPVQIQAHAALFSDVARRNHDIKGQGHVVVSERGKHVRELQDIYGWSPSYYFFHGWACLDWYRGYDRTYLFTPPDQRAVPSRTFMCPNRIIGGERDHRTLFVYHCLRLGLTHNYISAPAMCPVESQSIVAIGNRYCNIYPDIEQVLATADLPWLFAGEQTQQMTSCWLGNFHEAMQSLIYVPTETVYFGDRTHVTEKTFKAIALGMPFVLVAAANTLEYLREYGFRTFHHIWDESYDEEADDLRRLERVTALLHDIEQCSAREKTQIHRHCMAAVQHNWNHFYHGGFERILWDELQVMLHALAT